MRKHVSAFEQARRIYKSTHEDLESRLHASLDTLRENEATLQMETKQRQQLAESLAATNNRLGEQTQKGEKLESQLTKYQNIKQGMMQTLLTGKIRFI